MFLKQVIFEFETERLSEIDLLVVRYGFKDRTELFNHSVTLLQWVANTTQEGRMVAGVDTQANVYHELQMAFIERIRLMQQLGGGEVS